MTSNEPINLEYFSEVVFDKQDIGYSVTAEGKKLFNNVSNYHFERDGNKEYTLQEWGPRLLLSINKDTNIKLHVGVNGSQMVVTIKSVYLLNVSQQTFVTSEKTFTTDKLTIWFNDNLESSE